MKIKLGEKINKRRIVGVLLLVVSVLTLFGMSMLYKERGDTKNIVVVKRDIAAGEVITKEMLEKEQRGIYGMKKSYFEDEKEVLGQFAGVAMCKGDVVFKDKLSSYGLSKAAITAGKDNKGIIAIPVNLAAGLSTSLSPGDKVAVWAYDENIEEAVLYPELASLTVFAVENQQGSAVSKNKESKSGGTDSVPAVISLVVKDNVQAQALIKVVYQNKLHLELVSAGKE